MRYEEDTLATSVQSAFNQFRTQVDIEAETYKTARSSRDFLTGRITTLSNSDVAFPKVTGRYIPYGSLARKTKIGPLDDIDLLVILNGKGTSEESYLTTSYDPYCKGLAVTSSSSPLAGYADNGYVNSRRVLNRMKAEITQLHNYKNSAIKTNLQALTLQLKTQPWNFDLVPAVEVASTISGQSVVMYYLIPNGQGHWMRTDPRKNSADTTAANLKHSGLLLPTLRVLKYWNRRVHKPRLGSFYFETLALKVFANAPAITTIREAVEYFFINCPSYLYGSCPSPTGHGPNLDASVDWETKQKVSAAMQTDVTSAQWALHYERQGDIHTAIAYWKKVFGSGFPNYG